METKTIPVVDTWRRHIHALAADIGPRGSTTAGERRAAEYCAQVMSDLGLVPHINPFTSPRSAYRFHLLVAVLSLAAFAIYPLGGRASAGLAAAIILVALYCEIMELMFRDNPLRQALPKGTSQNVVATVPASGEQRQDVILMGHLDTNRAALVFSSTGWTDLWRILAPVIFLSWCIQAVLYVLGTATQWGWVWAASGLSAICSMAMVAISLQADASPFSPGANDNASGAALVLALGERLAAEPLQNTRVWLVNTGCEEVKHYGAIHFLRRYRECFCNPAVIVFEMLGRDGLAWLEHEMIIPPFAYRADPDLAALLDQVGDGAAVHPARVLGGHTEMADALRIGIPALTLIGIGPDGVGLGYSGPELYWHRLDDTVEHIDTGVLARNYALTWDFIQALDARAVEPCDIEEPCE